MLSMKTQMAGQQPWMLLKGATQVNLPATHVLAGMYILAHISGLLFVF